MVRGTGCEVARRWCRALSLCSTNPRCSWHDDLPCPRVEVARAPIGLPHHMTHDHSVMTKASASGAKRHLASLVVRGARAPRFFQCRCGGCHGNQGVSRGTLGSARADAMPPKISTGSAMRRMALSSPWHWTPAREALAPPRRAAPTWVWSEHYEAKCSPESHLSRPRLTRTPAFSSAGRWGLRQGIRGSHARPRPKTTSRRSVEVAYRLHRFHRDG